MSDDTQTGDAADEAHAALLEWLRVTKAASIFMVDKDGKRRRLQLRNGQNRWVVAARVIMRALEDLDHIEAEDKRGGVIDLWRAPEPVDVEAEKNEREKLERDEDERKAPRELRALAVLGRMLQEAADHATKSRSAEQRDLLNYIMEGNKAQQARLEVLERSMTGMLKTVFEAYKTRAQLEGFIAGGGLKGNEQPQDPGEALLIQLLAQKMGVQLPQLAGAPAPVANGHDPQQGNEPGDGSIF